MPDIAARDFELTLLLPVLRRDIWAILQAMLPTDVDRITRDVARTKDAAAQVDYLPDVIRPLGAPLVLVEQCLYGVFLRMEYRAAFVHRFRSDYRWHKASGSWHHPWSK